jgi:hypothetical protein
MTDDLAKMSHEEIGKMTFAEIVDKTRDALAEAQRIEQHVAAVLDAYDDGQPCKICGQPAAAHIGTDA